MEIAKRSNQAGCTKQVMSSSLDLETVGVFLGVLPSQTVPSIENAIACAHQLGERSHPIADAVSFIKINFLTCLATAM